MPSPFRREGLWGRTGPFLAAAVIGFASIPLPGTEVTNEPALVIAAALMAAIVGLVPLWRALPRPLQAAPALIYVAVVVLLRAAEGGATSGFAALLLLPVFWLAAYGTRGELAMALVVVMVGLVLPILLIGDPTYPASEWRRAVLTGTVAIIVGFTVQGLVSEIRHRARELSGERNRLGAILDNLADGVIACDAEGNVTVINQVACELHDLSGDSVLPSGWIENVRVYQPDGRTLLTPAEMPLVRALQGETVTDEELMVVPRGRGNRYVSHSAQPLVDGASVRRGAVVVIADTTERKVAERLKDQFFALVSHELRTPLTSILGYLEVVLEEDLDDDTRGLLEVAQRNGRRLERLVGDLLFIAQIEVGELPLEMGETDLVATATEAVGALQHRAKRRSIELTLETETLPTLRGDAQRLAQVFDNLILNAIKYTPEGGRIEVRVRRANDEVVVEVVDSGIGIARDELERVFERFFRASGATQRMIQGVGLGLSVVEAIVNGHGGTVEVESEEDVGTTFRVRLPLTAASAAVEPEPSGGAVAS